MRPKRYRLTGKQGPPPKPYVDPGREASIYVYLQHKGTETEPELLAESGLLWNTAMAERVERLAKEAREMKEAADKQREEARTRRKDAARQGERK